MNKSSLFLGMILCHSLVKPVSSFMGTIKEMNHRPASKSLAERYNECFGKFHFHPFSFSLETVLKKTKFLFR